MSGIPRQNVLLGALFSLGASAVGGSAAAVAKWHGGTLSPWFIVWVQYGICSLLMLPWVMRHGWHTLRTNKPGLHLIRSAGGWLGFASYYLALPYIPLADAALLRSAAPLWVPLIVLLLWKTRIAPVRWIALVAGFLGVMIMLRPDAGGISGGHWLGLLAGFSLALSMACTRELSSTEPAQRVLFYYFFLAFLASTPMALPHLLWPTAGQLIALFYIGVAIFITMILYNRAYTLAPTTIAAPLGYIAVPLAALMDWLIWRQLPDFWDITGTLLVIAAAIVAIVLGQRSSGHH